MAESYQGLSEQLLAIRKEMKEQGAFNEKLLSLMNALTETVNDLKKDNAKLEAKVDELQENFDILEQGSIEFAENKVQNKYNNELKDVKKNRLVEIYKVDSKNNSAKFYKTVEEKISIEEAQLDYLKHGKPYIHDEVNKEIVPVLNEDRDLIGIVVGDAENEREREVFANVVGNKKDTMRKLLINEITRENATAYLEEAQMDKLTQLYNRCGCEYECKKRTVTAMKQGLPCSLLMIDGDRFKDINEQYGHAAGDLVLQTIANTIKQYTSEENDIVVRDGGDEFFVVLNDCNGLEAYDVGQAIRRTVEALEILNVDGRIIKTSVSTGVAEIQYYHKDINEENVMDIINENKRIADENLDVAKKGYGETETGRSAGKNLVVATSEIEEQVRQRYAMQVEQGEKEHEPQRSGKDKDTYNARMARVTARSSISEKDVNVFVNTFLDTYKISLTEINDKEYTVTFKNGPVKTLRYDDGGKALVDCLVDSRIGQNVYRAYSEKLDKTFGTQNMSASEKITEIFSHPIHMVTEKDCQWEILYTMLVTEKETKENVLSSYVSPENIIHGDKQKGDNEHEL